MPITKGFRALVDEALAEVTTLSVDDARARLGQPGVKFVDLRDPRELEGHGLLPGAFHAPRGMLEFWVDPASPYHKPFFADEQAQYLLYCGGGWRSALAAKALQDMGMRNVAHIDGGFSAWLAQGGPTETLAQRQARKAAAG